jgi:hypothetical protein
MRTLRTWRASPRAPRPSLGEAVLDDSLDEEGLELVLLLLDVVVLLRLVLLEEELAEPVRVLP